MAAKSGAGTLHVTQTKSSISHIARNRATLRALGLHGIGSSVQVPANDATRGMVRQVCRRPISAAAPVYCPALIMTCARLARGISCLTKGMGGTGAGATTLGLLPSLAIRAPLNDPVEDSLLFGREAEAPLEAAGNGQSTGEAAKESELEPPQAT